MVRLNKKSELMLMRRVRFAGNLGLFSSILLQFAILQPKITKNAKNPYFGGLRSSMLTFLQSSSPVLVMISSMSVPNCNHFHARQANSG